MVWSNRHTEGCNERQIAMRLNPHDPVNGLWASQIAVSYYFEHDYVNAVEAAKHTAIRYCDIPTTYRWLAASLGQLVGPPKLMTPCYKPCPFRQRNSMFMSAAAHPGIRPNITSTCSTACEKQVGGADLGHPPPLRSIVPRWSSPFAGWPDLQHIIARRSSSVLRSRLQPLPTIPTNPPAQRSPTFCHVAPPSSYWRKRATMVDVAHRAVWPSEPFPRPGECHRLIIRRAGA